MCLTKFVKKCPHHLSDWRYELWILELPDKLDKVEIGKYNIFPFGISNKLDAENFLVRMTKN